MKTVGWFLPCCDLAGGGVTSGSQQLLPDAYPVGISMDDSSHGGGAAYSKKFMSSLSPRTGVQHILRTF